MIALIENGCICLAMSLEESRLKVCYLHIVLLLGQETEPWTFALMSSVLAWTLVNDRSTSFILTSV